MADKIEYIVAGEKVDANGQKIDGEGEVSRQTLADSQAQGTFDVENASKEELEAEAARRGVIVGRSDGKAGAPVMDDYRTALGG